MQLTIFNLSLQETQKRLRFSWGDRRCRTAFRQFRGVTIGIAGRAGVTWDMLKNGALLAEAERAGFSVLITSDKGIGTAINEGAYDLLISEK